MKKGAHNSTRYKVLQRTEQGWRYKCN